MLASSTLTPISTEDIFATGRRRPILVRCRETTADGGSKFTSVVMKTFAQDFPPTRAIVEAVASEWASAVGLRTPRCWLLLLSDEQAAVLSREGRAVQPGLAFASEYLANALQVTPGNRVSNEDGTAILVFDDAIQNSDRSQHNSNCLTLNDLPYVIDHEASLDFFVDGHAADPTFGDGYITAMHVFMPRLRAFVHQRLDLAAVVSTTVGVDLERVRVPRNSAATTFAEGLKWALLSEHLRQAKQKVSQTVANLTLHTAR